MGLAAGALGTIGAGGSDAALERRLAVIAGTSACHLALVPEGQKVRGVWGPYYGALLPERWLLEAGISASGAFLDHALRQFTSAVADASVLQAAELAACEIEAAGQSMTDLTRDLHLQCNVLGNRAPLADPTLTGGLSGWVLRNDSGELARWYVAALQSLAYATRHIIETMRDAAIGIDLLVVSGGSASNARWRQIHADVLGIPVAVPAQRDGVLLGAAMLAARATGLHASLATAMLQMNQIAHIAKPDTTTRAFHDAKYAVYRRMLEDQHAYAEMMRGTA